MKRFSFVLVISISFLVSAMAFLKPVSKTATYLSSTDEPKKVINITLASEDAPQVCSDLYSLNLTDIYDEVLTPGDTQFLKLVKGLHPRIVRWPGGIASNFTHAMENGYGYHKFEVAGVSVKIAQKFEDQGRFERQQKVYHPYLQDIVQFVRMNNAKLLLVLNVATGTVQEAVDEINYVKESGVELAGVELGDELYMQSMHIIFPFPGSYINKASAFTVALRKSFPDLKIAVCAAPYNRTGDAGNFNNVQQSTFGSWNDALARNKFYDAVAIHFYCPMGVKREVSTDSTFRFAVHELEAMYYSSGLIPLAMDYYANIFPKTKMWMTEWNLAPIFTQSFYYNTLYQGVYMHLFLNYLNTYNAENSNDVEIAIFQSMATSGMANDFGLITSRGEKEKLPTSFVKRVAYYAFQDFEDLFDNRSQAHAMKITSILPGKMGVYAYKDTCAKALWLYWYNMSGKSATIGNLIMDKDTIKPDKMMYVNQLSGALSSSFGFTRFSRANNNQPPNIDDKPMRLSEFIIPENGFGYCRIDSIR